MCNKDSLEKLKTAKKFFVQEVSELEDETIKDAWEGMECDPPWTVERFLDQMSSYKNNFLELSDIGTVLK